jgi:WXXGXW repeat (2 copies)
MKTKLLVILLLAGGSLFAAPRVFVGIGVGGYGGPAPIVAYAPPPAPLVTYAPSYVRPGYAWVEGYWYPRGPRYFWRPGYWARRPYAGAYWVAPRYYRHRYYRGYWRR